jgi:hypothetical protein
MTKSKKIRRLIRFGLGFGLMAGLLFLSSRAGQESASRLVSELKGPFDLAGRRSPQIQYFQQEAVFVHIGFDGKRTGAETYTLKLKCVPAAVSGKGGDEYTCASFQVRIGEGKPVSIPSLSGWTYVFSLSPQGIDEKGQVFGIPHGKFENIVDGRGNALPAGISYAIYNNFIDFHSFNDVLARPTAAGGGIQDLRTIGQRIIHAAAFSEPPVNLGSRIKAGSVFRNGEMSLEFKGVSVVEGAACAIVGYDSGESTLKMIMPVAADRDIVTVGGSQYKGDIYIDLATRWVRKVTLDEFVVTETQMPGPAPKIDAYTVRHLLTRLISREEYEEN